MIVFGAEIKSAGEYLNCTDRDGGLLKPARILAWLSQLESSLP